MQRATASALRASSAMDCPGALAVCNEVSTGAAVYQRVSAPGTVSTMNCPFSPHIAIEMSELAGEQRQARRASLHKTRNMHRAFWEDTLRKLKLGAHLARDLECQLGSYLPEPLPADERKKAGKSVSRLFSGAKRQLAGVVAAGAGPIEVIVAPKLKSPQRETCAIGVLERSSGSLQWTRAIECPSHDFHAQWVELKNWALHEGLYLAGRTELHPVYNTTVYVLVAWPAGDV